MAALLAAGLITSASGAGSGLPATASPEAAVPPIAASSPEITVTPTVTPIPLPTPRTISVALFFRRPARVIPVHRKGGEEVILSQDFEITDETPWLTETDVRAIKYPPGEHPDLLRLQLYPRGVTKYDEARMGNYGRQIILVIDGTVRSRIPMKRIGPGDRGYIDFPGDFSPAELESLQAQFARRALPTPTPPPSPTPAPKKRFIVR